MCTCIHIRERNVECTIRLECLDCKKWTYVDDSSKTHHRFASDCTYVI